MLELVSNCNWHIYGQRKKYHKDKLILIIYYLSYQINFNL